MTTIKKNIMTRNEWFIFVLDNNQDECVVFNRDDFLNYFLENGLWTK